MRRVVRWSLEWFYQSMFALSPKRAVDGMTVSVFTEGGEALAQAADKLSAALALLRMYSPRTHSSVRRLIPRVFAIAIAAVGKYLPSVGLCLVDRDILTSEAMTAERLACTLVHEATHARLFRVGIPYSRTNKFRVERICVRAEIAVAQQFPNWAELQPELEADLANAETLWSTANHRAATIGRLYELEVPRWLIRAVERASNRRAG